jgi:hypothetical protein
VLRDRSGEVRRAGEAVGPFYRRRMAVWGGIFPGELEELREAATGDAMARAAAGQLVQGVLERGAGCGWAGGGGDGSGRGD